MSQTKYSQAVDILGKLQNDEEGLTTCLMALNHAMKGQQQLDNGEIESALAQSKQAEVLFEKVPLARSLLGVCKADIAAAYGRLEKYDVAAQYARESISLVSGDKEYAFTEAMAHVKLGTSLFFLGKGNDGSAHFEKAKNILSEIPNGSDVIETLDQNEQHLRQLTKSKKNKWWCFWE